MGQTTDGPRVQAQGMRPNRFCQFPGSWKAYQLYNLESLEEPVIQGLQIERKTFPVSLFPLQRTQKDKLSTN